MAEERLQITVDEKGALVVKRKLEGVGEGARKAGGGVKLLRTALGGLATIGIGAVLTSAVKTMASFSQEMSTVKAISRATGDQFEELTAQARQLGATTRFSATQAAQGMVFLARAGFDTNQVLSAIGPTLQLAQAGALGLGQAADIASNVLTGFRISADDAQRVIDVLALAANSANTDVQQLGDAMSYVAPIASSLRVPLEETAAAIQTLSDAGIQSSRAGTNLTMVMRRLEAPVAAQRQVLDELGVSLDDVRVSEVGLTKALENLRDSGATTGQIFRLFGRNAAAASVLLAGTTGKLQQFTSANEQAQGTAAEVAKTMDDNLNGALLAVRSAWEELQLAFGDQGPQSALTQGLKNLATILRTVAANIELATTTATALGVSIVAIKFAPFLQSISSAAGALGLLNKGLVATKAALAGLALNPITVGLLALSAAVVAVNAAFDKFNKLQAEIEAIEERTYKMRLKRLQAQVREIQERKAANAALEAYIDNLELENKFMGMTEQAQEEQINLTRALEIAKRPLTELEKERIITLLKERDAIKAANDRRQEEEELLKAIKQPAAEYAHQVELLDALKARGAITAKEYAAALREIQEQYGQLAEAGGGNDYIARLQRENELLQMNTKEQEVQRALDAARSSGGGNLSEEEAQRVRDLVTEQQKLREARDKDNQALADQQRLLSEIKGPQEEYRRAEAALDALLDQKVISLEEYKQKLKELDEAMQGSVRQTTTVMDQTWGSVWDNASRSLDEFASSGKASFRDLTASILGDLQKIIQKQLLIMAFRAVGIPIPGFAGGGSFTVGGQPGVDKNLVAFRATRGEQVDITRAGQQPAAQQAVVAQAAAPIIRIVNISDPSEVSKYLNGTDGEQVIINVVGRNGDAIKQAWA